MSTSLQLYKYKALLENSILNFIEQALESNSITPEKIQEIARYVKENIISKESIEEIEYSLIKFKELFPDCRNFIDKSIDNYLQQQKYKIG